MQMTFGMPRGRVHFHRGRWQEMDLPDRFALLGDPPYGDEYRSNYHLGHGIGQDRDRSAPGSRTLATGIDGDEDTAERDAFLDRGGWVVAAVYGPSVTKVLTRPELRPWGTGTPHGPIGVLVVDKGGGAGGGGDLRFPWKLGTTETIALYGKWWMPARSETNPHGPERAQSVLRSRVIAFGRGSAPNGRRHPNEKDLRNAVEILERMPPELPVVDPWGGSGTTAEACIILGRTCYLAEKDPTYWPVIEQRIAVHGAIIV